jgi:hypothetical protein
MNEKSSIISWENKTIKINEKVARLKMVSYNHFGIMLLSNLYVQICHWNFFLDQYTEDSTFIRWSNICALCVAVVLLSIFIWHFYSTNAVFVKYYEKNGDIDTKAIQIIAFIISLLEGIRIPLKVRQLFKILTATGVQG